MWGIKICGFEMPKDYEPKHATGNINAANSSCWDSVKAAMACCVGEKKTPTKQVGQRSDANAPYGHVGERMTLGNKPLNVLLEIPNPVHTGQEETFASRISTRIKNGGGDCIELKLSEERKGEMGDSTWRHAREEIAKAVALGRPIVLIVACHGGTNAQVLSDNQQGKCSTGLLKRAIDFLYPGDKAEANARLEVVGCDTEEFARTMGDETGLRCKGVKGIAICGTGNNKIAAGHVITTDPRIRSEQAYWTYQEALEKWKDYNEKKKVGTKHAGYRDTRSEELKGEVMTTHRALEMCAATKHINGSWTADHGAQYVGKTRSHDNIAALDGIRAILKRAKESLEAGGKLNSVLERQIRNELNASELAGSEEGKLLLAEMGAAKGYDRIKEKLYDVALKFGAQYDDKTHLFKKI